MCTLTFDEAKRLVLCHYSENGYSKNRWYRVKSILKRLDELLSPRGPVHGMEGIEAFIRQRGLPYGTACDFRRLASMIFTAMETGTVNSDNIRAFKAHSLRSSEFRFQLGNYISLQIKQGKAPSTIHFEEWANRGMLVYLESMGVTKFSDILPMHLLNYQKLKIPSFTQSTGQGMIYRIRHFLEYLILEGKVHPTLLPCIQSRIMQREQVVSVLSEQQRLTLMSMPKPITVKEAREKAVILCALRLGLRRSDIYKLKLEEIDWERQRISLVQRKTRQPLVLPLPQEVGETIADYILHFRPECKSEFVFLSLRAPYGAIKGNDVIAKRLDDPPASKGYHILRRTCATYLMNNGIGAQTIMNILGQQSPSSLNCYLNLDKGMMEQNSLRLDIVGLPEVLS